MAIVVSAACSVYLFHLALSWLFLTGATLVVMAVALYSFTYQDVATSTSVCEQRYTRVIISCIDDY